MKIKLKDKNKPVTKMWCFSYSGYSSDLIDKINAGKTIVVDKVPKPAWDYVEK